jgi:hypothetical protein
MIKSEFFSEITKHFQSGQSDMQLEGQLSLWFNQKPHMTVTVTVIRLGSFQPRREVVRVQRCQHRWQGSRCRRVKHALRRSSSEQIAVVKHVMGTVLQLPSLHAVSF